MVAKVKSLYSPKNKAQALKAHDFDIAIRPYDADAKGVYQEPLFTLEKKLYASQDYLEKHGAPKTVEDLKNHRLIGRFILRAEEYPFSNANWLLKVGRPSGEPGCQFFGTGNLPRQKEQRHYRRF
jgi:DNA-binding transcriptional LysR family regulator